VAGIGWRVLISRGSPGPTLARYGVPPPLDKTDRGRWMWRTPARNHRQINDTRAIENRNHEPHPCRVMQERQCGLDSYRAQVHTDINLLPHMLCIGSELPALHTFPLEAEALRTI
jgi:hypothetical protein